MTIAHASGVRNSLANVVGDAADVGSGSDNMIEIRDGTTPVVRFPTNDTAAFDTAPATATGVITLDDTPIEAAAIDDGASVDNFILKDKDGATVLTGSVTATGMGGDIEVTNTNIANGQDCSLESLTYTAPV